MRELVSEADQFVVATVTAIGHEAKAEDGLPLTLYALRVEERIHGEGLDTFELVLAGGPVGDRLLVIPGVPRLEEGETVAAAVAAMGGERYRLVAVGDLFRRVEEAETGTVTVVGRERRPVLDAACDAATVHGPMPGRRGNGDEASDDEPTVELDELVPVPSMAWDDVLAELRACEPAADSVEAQ